MTIPVILDTDIGGDIDDTWALALLLKSPELDVKLIVTSSGDTACRARITARLLEIGGRTDVPIGVGIPLEYAPAPQAPWVAGYDLAHYPGIVVQDGVGAMVDAIMRSPAPVTLIGIGPLPNLAAALAREPEIARRARFIGMCGSVRRGYLGDPETAREYNASRYPHATRAVLTAPWDATITPLDTCGVVRLTGEKYRAVTDCADPLVRAVIENYAIWSDNNQPPAPYDPAVESSVLYDTVAVYLAFSEELLEMERLGIRVTDDGATVVDAAAKEIACAMAWKDLAGYEDFLVRRLTG